ncbi:MAG: 50S ribosomal protein L29 [Chloroflexi bacterium RBG_13_54_9]|nr:MAG: 50S ribosomal protein L29 [Chloroflexi bacterium RBG_13_54_9]
MTVKADEIRALGPEELDKQIEEARRELFNLRFRLETRQLANYREIQKVKRRIARLLTVKRERELAIR